MIAARTLFVIPILFSDWCFGQSASSDSLFIDFKNHIEIEQSLNSGVCHMDYETTASYYALLKNSTIESLIKYTNDSNPCVRAYVIEGLLRFKQVSEEELIKIIKDYDDDTTEFSIQSVDVVIPWTVKEYIQFIYKIRGTARVSDSDLEDRIRKNQENLKSQHSLSIKGIKHGTLDKNELLKIDCLIPTNKDLELLSFKLIVDDYQTNSSSCYLTTEMKNAFAKTEKGSLIIIENIRAASQDGFIVRLPSLHFRIK